MNWRLVEATLHAVRVGIPVKELLQSYAVECLMSPCDLFRMKGSAADVLPY